MSVKKLDRNVLNSLIDKLISSGRNVTGVQAKGDRFAFDKLDSARELRLDYDVTLLPPKKYFQPQVETLLTFKVADGYKSVDDSAEMILIGVHPYDMVAINQMDAIFSQDQCDRHYVMRRQKATIIVCDVATPSKNVFAASMGNAVVHEGYDILLTDIGDGFVAEAATEKGESLLAMEGGASDASPDDLAKRGAVWQHNEYALSKHKLGCKPSDLPGLLEKAYKHPVWEEKARTCYSCGSCNQVCPTCYCFDVQDELNWDMQSGQRCRVWDGCLLEPFATVAGNHNFRKNRADRFRHRLYRKGMYVPAKIGGQIACVGCGRCVGACLPDIANPVAVYNRILEDVKP
jgi:sulfhydrogenase subunit beta (sulfur reductase)